MQPISERAAATAGTPRTPSVAPALRAVAAGAPRSPIPKGEATRARIIQHALELARHVGLESLSIGDLAQELGLSKSGLFAHFGSKERLLLDVHARRAFEHLLADARA
jgi:AcrR family transcriptional regulator